MSSLFELSELARQDEDFKRYLKGAALGASLATAGVLSHNNDVPHKNINNPTHKQSIIQSQPTITTNTKEDPFVDYILPHEKLIKHIYKDGRGYLTIGVGHLITPETRQIFQQLFRDSVDYDAVIAGKPLTEEECKLLFKYDLNKHLIRARHTFPHFEEYPIYVQQALLDSIYRGDMGKITAHLINAGKWRAAAKEYLNRKDYRNRVAMGIRGIGPRMESNRNRMLKYADELGVNENLDLTTFGNENKVDESQIDAVYDKAKISIKLVRLYDETLPEDQKLLKNVSSVVNLASGAYGFFNSGENYKLIPSNIENKIRYKFGDDYIKKIHKLPQILLSKYYPELKGQIKRGSVIHVNVHRVLAEMGDSLAAIVEIASTCIHEATHEKERELTGKTSEVGPVSAEKAFKIWFYRNEGMIINRVQELRGYVGRTPVKMEQFIKKPSILYHRSPKENRDSILKFGLLDNKSNTSSGIYMSDKPQQKSNLIDTWQVNTRGLHLEEDFNDNPEELGNWYVYYNDIPKTRLKLIQ